MNRTLRVAFTILMIHSFPAIGQPQSNPVAYLDAIGMEFQKISEDMMSYISAANRGKSARKVDKRRTEVLLTMKEAERNTRRLKPYEGDSRLRDSLAVYFRLCQIVLNQDYEKILNMEDIAEQSYDAMEAYMLAKKLANEKIESANDAAEKEFKAFAAKYNIKLLESKSKLTEKMAAVKKVNDYYDKLYLLFFRSYKNEVYLLDAVNRGDINAMEQTREALSSSATEDLPKVGSIGAFDGDASVKTACTQLLKFYQAEVGKNMTDVIDFFVKKDNFEKIKKAFDAMRASDRKQADIDKFNQAVKEYNASVDVSNKALTAMNKQRSAALNTWTKSVEDFLQRHTPRHN